jgi:hypothetical protein
MRAIGRLAGEFLCVCLSGVVGFVAMLLLVACTVLAWLIGCASALFLLIAMAEAIWWLHTYSYHAAVTSLGYFGYSAGTFALIPILVWSKDRLAERPERQRRRTTLRQMAHVALAEDANFEEVEPPRRSYLGPRG